MTSSAPDPAAAHPMLHVLRERHPEVDVVVLPGPVPPRADTPTLDTAQLAELAQAADDALADVLAGLSRQAAWTGAERGGRWRTDEWGLVHYESVASVRDLAEGGNVALLRTTGSVLVEQGWRARPLPGDPSRLAARRGALDASASVRPAELVLSVRTARVRRADEVPGHEGEDAR